LVLNTIKVDILLPAKCYFIGKNCIWKWIEHKNQHHRVDPTLVYYYLSR